MIKNVYWSLSLFMSDFKKNLILVNRFSKNYQIPDEMKIRPAGAELSHSDGRTDRQTP